MNIEPVGKNEGKNNHSLDLFSPYVGRSTRKVWAREWKDLRRYNGEFNDEPLCILCQEIVSGARGTISRT